MTWDPSGSGGPHQALRALGQATVTVRERALREALERVVQQRQQGADLVHGGSCDTGAAARAGALGALREDAEVQLLGGGAGLGAQLLDQGPSQVEVGAERVAPGARRREGPHQQLPRELRARVVPDRPSGELLQRSGSPAASACEAARVQAWTYSPWKRVRSCAAQSAYGSLASRSPLTSSTAAVVRARATSGAAPRPGWTSRRNWSMSTSTCAGSST